MEGGGEYDLQSAEWEAFFLKTQYDIMKKTGRAKGYGLAMKAWETRYIDGNFGK